MKASELMIGNYVMAINNYEDIFYVNCIYGHRDLNITSGIYKNYDTTIRDIKPIPLTEEWLLKFGFDLINNEYYQSRNHELKLYWTVNKNKMIPEFNEKRFVTGYDFKYAHQLQNLYFILTGEELTIKNK
jgi:hypothetical protein